MPLITEVGRRNLRIRIFFLAISAFLWMGVLLHLFPIWWMLTTSIKSAGEIFQFPPSLWPRSPNLASYKLFFVLSAGDYGPLIRPVYVYLKNSCIITAGILAIQIPVTSLLAYAVSKLYGPKWNKVLFLYCIGTLMVASSVALIPRFLIIQHFPFPTRNIPNLPFTNQEFPSINLYNSYWGVIIPASYSAFNFLLFKGFFDGIPDELISAARLDGASEIGIFRRLVVPLSKPVFAVTAYFTFCAAWNDFLWPFIVLRENRFFPLSVVMYKFSQTIGTFPKELQSEEMRRLIESGMGTNGLMAMAIIESIPVFIVFIIFREQLMTGIKLRGFK